MTQLFQEPLDVGACVEHMRVALSHLGEGGEGNPSFSHTNRGLFLSLAGAGQQHAAVPCSLWPKTAQSTVHHQQHYALLQYPPGRPFSALKHRLVSSTITAAPNCDNKAGHQTTHTAQRIAHESMIDAAGRPETEPTLLYSSSQSRGCVGLLAGCLLGWLCCWLWLAT